MSDEPQLKLHIEALEALADQKQEIADDIKDRFALAKADGYDKKILGIVLRRRQIERDALAEQDALVETYEAALA